MRKALPLASMTAREILASPLPWAASGVTAVLLLLSTLLPSFTLEEGGDLKFMLDVGLSGMAVALLVAGLWPSTTLLVDELTQKTALTLLAKPLSRPAYLAGRYLGILQALGVLWAGLTLWLITCVWISESQFLAAPLDAWFEEAAYGVEVEIPPLPNPPLRWNLAATAALGLGQAALLCALAVAFSTRLQPLANLACCAAVFVAGHLSEGLALPFRILVPQLGLFDPSEAVSRGISIPVEYAAACLLYAGVYAAATLLAALPLFERQELT